MSTKGAAHRVYSTKRRTPSGHHKVCLYDCHKMCLSTKTKCLYATVSNLCVCVRDCHKAYICPAVTKCVSTTLAQCLCTPVMSTTVSKVFLWQTVTSCLNATVSNFCVYAIVTKRMSVQLPRRVHVRQAQCL
jgi:hypothetical protein